MNIINLSLLLANAAILASASATATPSTFSNLTGFLKATKDSVSNEANKMFTTVKNEVGTFSNMVSTSAKDSFNSLSSKAVKENEPVKLDRIMACKATGSKDDFIKAIKAYADFDNKDTPSATSGDASIPDSKDANSSKKDSDNVITAAPNENASSTKVLITGTPNENASSTKDTKLKPYDLALKKLIVLFNCPKSNALLAELTEDEMKLGQTEIPDIVKVALKQKLLQFPFGSLQVDYDQTLEKCVKSINQADHDDICQNASCTEDDVKNLKTKLVNLEYCSHHFIQDSIKKIADEVLKNEQVKKLGNNDNDKPELKPEFTLRRPDLLEIIKKIANTLPRIQMGTGNFVNRNLLEKTSLKCRANLQKLLGISEPDVPSYDYLFREDKIDGVGANAGAGDGDGDDLKKPATYAGANAGAGDGATPTVTDAGDGDDLKATPDGVTPTTPGTPVDTSHSS
jgi:hypothetical protein